MDKAVKQLYQVLEYRNQITDTSVKGMTMFWDMKVQWKKGTITVRSTLKAYVFQFCIIDSDTVYEAHQGFN